MIKNIIRKQFYKMYLERYDSGKEVFEKMQQVKGYTMSTPIDLATLYEIVIHLDKYKIEGDFVECGVWKGGSAGIMALANLAHSNERRDIHLFDLFDDIVAPDMEKDGEIAVKEIMQYIEKTNINKDDYFGKLKPIKGIYDSHGGYGSTEIVEKFMVETINYPSENIRLHKGLFQDTVINTPDIDKIALLRLDGDWYDSIKICLDNLYDKVVEGGVVIIDDVGTYDGCRKAVNDFFMERNLKYFLNYSRPQTRFFFK